MIVIYFKEITQPKFSVKLLCVYTPREGGANLTPVHKARTGMKGVIGASFSFIL